MQVLKVSEVWSSDDNDDDILNCSSNSSVASDVVDSIDFANALPVTVNSATVFVVALWLKLAPLTQESEIIEKWFAGICTVRKKVLLYICWAGKQKVSDWQWQGINIYWMKLFKAASTWLYWIYRKHPLLLRPWYHSFVDTWYHCNDIGCVICQQW